MNWGVDRPRIRDYLLNATHPSGAAKARYFLAAGFDPSRWEVFRDALANHPLTASLDTVDPTSQYGEKRTYRCSVASPNGRNRCIVTVWQQSGGDFHLIPAARTIDVPSDASRHAGESRYLPCSVSSVTLFSVSIISTFALCQVSLGRCQQFKDAARRLRRLPSAILEPLAPPERIVRYGRDEGTRLPTEPRNVGIVFSRVRNIFATGPLRSRKDRVRPPPAVPPRSVRRATPLASRRARQRIPPARPAVPRPLPASVAAGSAAEPAAVRRADRRACVRRDSVPGVEPAPAKALGDAQM